MGGCPSPGVGNLGAPPSFAQSSCYRSTGSISPTRLLCPSPGKAKPATGASPSTVPSVGTFSHATSQQPQTLAPLAMQATPQVTTPQPRSGTGEGGEGWRAGKGGWTWWGPPGEASACCRQTPRAETSAGGAGCRTYAPNQGGFPLLGALAKGLVPPRCCQRRVGWFARRGAGISPHPASPPPSPHGEGAPRSWEPSC